MTASSPPSSNSSRDGDGADALEQALALRAAPQRARLLCERPLPGSVLQLIRIAGGERESLASAVALTGESPASVVEAAVLYVQQVLFHDGADSYRTLGVDVEASAATIKEHYRWLMHWLHPDRQPERWEAAYAERVNRAWNSLNTERRRRDYDALRAPLPVAQADSFPIADTGPKPVVPAPTERMPILSPRMAGWVPAIVFGAMLLLAAGVMVASWHDGLAGQADASAASTRLDAVLPGSDSAQRAAIRDRMAFEEHVVSLRRTGDDPPGQPAPPSTELQAGLAPGAGEARAGQAGASAVSAHDAPAALSRDFTAAYDRGDLVRFLGLFTSDAVDEHGGIAAISSDYGGLFDATSSRELDLGGVRWAVADDRIVGIGVLDVRIRRHDEGSDRHLRESIRIEAVPVEGRWKIQRLLRGEGP